MTLEDIDPLHGEHAHGWWYIGLRLDVATYAPERQGFDVLLVSDEEPRGGELDAPLAMPRALLRWIGRGRGMAHRPLMIGIQDDHVYVVAEVDPARLRGRLPARMIVVDRTRGVDQVVVEGVITERDVAGWK